MPVELRRKPKPDRGLKSKWWYGSFIVNDRRHVIRLGVKVKGTPPDSIKKTGDTAFEVSRQEAKDALNNHVEKARRQNSSESLVQDLHAIRYGTRISSYPISKLIEAWDKIPKKRQVLHPRYVVDVHATLGRFISFVQKEYPKVIEASQVSRQIAHAFLDSDAKRGEKDVSEKSWNDTLKRLRATFHFLQIEYAMPGNPFDGIKSRTESNVHRRPFTSEEVTKLLKEVETDGFVRPLFVCGLGTAMRLGDCCTLRWDAVNMDGPNPSITVKTSKTGAIVRIPLYERLIEELIRAKKDSFGKSEYVWPLQAAMHQENQQGVTWRIRRAFKNALGKDNLRIKRLHGLRDASVKDFHSLRTTWITEALSRGVPIETVKLISGHRTTEVVTENYFHPDQSQVRQALEAAMPRLLTNGEPSDKVEKKTVKDEVLEICKGLLMRDPPTNSGQDPATSSTGSGQAWKSDIERIVALVEGM